MDSRLFWLALAAFVGSTEGGLIGGLLPSISAEMHISTGQSLAALLGVPLGALVAVNFNWRFDYAAIALMAAAASLALYLGLPRGMHGDTQTMRERMRVLRDRRVLLALVVSLLLYAGAAPVTIFVGAVIAQTGAGSGALPVVLLTIGIGAILATMTAGRLADHFGNRPMAIVAI